MNIIFILLNSSVHTLQGMMWRILKLISSIPGLIFFLCYDLCFGRDQQKQADQALLYLQNIDLRNHLPWQSWIIRTLRYSQHCSWMQKLTVLWGSESSHLVVYWRMWLRSYTEESRFSHIQNSNLTALDEMKMLNKDWLAYWCSQSQLYFKRQINVNCKMVGSNHRMSRVAKKRRKK